MSENGSDRTAISSVWDMDTICGEGSSQPLAEPDSRRSRKNEVMNCEIVTFPVLHQRNSAPIYQGLTGASALVLEFPAPRWQRNASARR